MFQTLWQKFSKIFGMLFWNLQYVFRAAMEWKIASSWIRQNWTCLWKHFLTVIWCCQLRERSEWVGEWRDWCASCSGIPILFIECQGWIGGTLFPMDIYLPARRRGAPPWYENSACLCDKLAKFRSSKGERRGERDHAEHLMKNKILRDDLSDALFVAHLFLLEDRKYTRTAPHRDLFFFVFWLLSRSFKFDLLHREDLAQRTQENASPAFSVRLLQ